MKRRIYLSFVALALLYALLLSASVSGVIYTAIRNIEMDAVRGRAILAADLLNNANVGGFTDFMNTDPHAARVTIIAPDGTVLVDSRADAVLLDDRSEREEVRQALQTGRGEAIRYSITLGADTYYYAIRLDDGNVLRVSKTMDRISGVFTAVLPTIVGVTALTLLVTILVAGRFVKNILRPLNDINFDSDGANVYDELLPFMQKIKQQKQKMDMQIDLLKKNADTTEVIIDNMKEGLVLIDKAGIMLAVNKSALDIFRAKDVAGKNILHICRDIEFHAGVKECLSGKDAEIVFRRDESIYSVYFSCVYEGEDMNGGVIFLLDITERYASEKQRREFSANVSHELKTPLTTISALAEMIETGMAQEGDVKAFAGKISVQTKRLINVIEDIIKLSEFDEGEIIAQHTEFDLRELALSVIEVLRENADEKHVSVNLSGEQFNMIANKQMIDELLYNLIDNAIKYNRDNGSVTITLSREDGGDKIAVADTGIGIDLEHQHRVFERFYRADKSRCKKTGGTGLGLSIVKHITEYHEGRVTLMSTPGSGTTIECYFGGKP